MFSLNVFDTELALAGAVTSSLIVGFVFVGMIVSYAQKRANKAYGRGKIKAPSNPLFSIVSKTLFVVSMLLTLTDYWFTSPVLLVLYENTYIQFAGALLVLIGHLSLQRALGALGENYSPFFDAHLPSTLVTTGIYRWVRHPVYLFNLFVSFGLAVSSGSLIVIISAIIGLTYILRTIALEEAYLKQHFDEYVEYSKKSWRLIPFCY